MSEEIKDEVTRGKEILSEEDGEQQLLALLDEARKNTAMTREQGSSKKENKVCLCVCVCVRACMCIHSESSNLICSFRLTKK